MRVARLFGAAGSVHQPGHGHRGYDTVEEELGLSRTLRVDVDPDASIVNLVDALGSLSEVEAVSPYYLSETPFATASLGAAVAKASARSLVGGDEALSMEPGDSTLIVGIVDSGVSLTHPELVGRLRPGYDAVDLPPDQLSRSIRLVGDTQTADRVPEDEQGHGTVCASIIGAVGVNLSHGLAGAAQLLPMRALAAAVTDNRPGRTAVGSIANIDEAVKLAVDLGAKVLNLSFGTPESALRSNDPVPHVEVVRYALARGCILVAASGNDGGLTRYFPAALPGVIAVGSVDLSRKPSKFMSRGEHVALCAPGERIRGATLNGSYGDYSGTSFAAPFVTSACALLLARAARYSASLSPFMVRDLLVRSVTPFQGGDSSGCGAGVLNLPATLRAADDLFQRELTLDGMDDTDDAPVIPATPAALSMEATV
jgi:subtilisin family serine protease